MSDTKLRLPLGNYIKRSKTDPNIDEFYTPYDVIADEMPYYSNHFEGKTLYFNCDDGSKSNLYKYFNENFAKYKLAKIIATGYNASGNGIKYEFDGTDETINQMVGDGSYLSDESLKILEESDVVITNPPFRNVCRFYKILFDAHKDFIVVSSNIATGIHYMCISRGIDLYNGHNIFVLKNEFNGKTKKCCWKTSIKTDGHIRKTLTKKFADLENPEWLDTLFKGERVLNVNRTKDIPIDYKGLIAVPITSLNEYYNIQYDIKGFGINSRGSDNIIRSTVNGKPKFIRVIVKIKGDPNEN